VRESTPLVGVFYRQLSPMTRTDDTRRCCAPLIEPLAEPVEPPVVPPAVVPPAVVPPAVVPPAVEPLPDDEPDMLVSSMPVTSTFLPAFELSCDCAEPPSRMYVEPEPMPAAELLLEPVVPVPPAVVPPAVVPPAVEPLLVVPELVPARELVELPEPLDMLAFVRMNDAEFPLPDVERDALVPDVALPLVEPDVPVAPAESPDCRQPVTVIVPLCAERFACDSGVWLLLLCAATIAVHPIPIANIHAARFMKASSSYRVRHLWLQAIRHHAPTRAVEASQWV
jgi:hypothetical protein